MCVHFNQVSTEYNKKGSILPSYDFATVIIQSVDVVKRYNSTGQVSLVFGHLEIMVTSQ